MAILTFLVVLVALILVHEWGHFIAAKKTGMRVDEFGVGFPPKLFGYRRGETEYSVNALPIGGFVRIFGEDLDAAKQDPDWPRAFSAQSKWAQAIVLVAGVVMNVLFAWLLFSLALTLGVPSAVEEAEAGPDAQLRIASVLPDSPAAAADIPVGVQVTQLYSDDTAVDEPLTPSTFTDFVAAHASEELTVVYQVDGTEQRTSIQPSAAVIPEDANKPAIGVALSLIEIQHTPWYRALYDGAVMTVTGLRDITIGLYGLATGAFAGTADFSQVAGPVGIVGLVDQATNFGITSLLLFTAIISLNLAVINLLPIPALDGGRLVMVAIEAVKGTPIPADWAVRVNTAGFLLLIGLMVAVTYNDILRLF